MSKFKAGDKVETPFGVGIFDSYVDGGFMSGSLRVRYEKVRTGGVYFWNEDDIKPYKTPHERLLELDWKVVDTDGIYKTYDNFDTKYTRMTMSIKINKDQDGWYFTTHNVFMDKELTTILLDYLEELEND